MNWNQLQTILWLRWRLTRNQWARHSGIGAVIAVIVAVGAVALGGLSFLGALLGGIYGLGQSKPLVVWIVWFLLTLVFLVFWMIGLLAELQRSETIDLQRLMHLPVALGQMFVVNYVVSHFTFSIVLIVPAMMGLAAGLVISRGPAMLLLAPLALSMVFMITAWTYCLRGWLAALMSNPRKRRAIVMGIAFAFVLFGQLPNLYFNVMRRNVPPSSSATPQEAQARIQAQSAAVRENLNIILAPQNYLPPFWLPVGAKALAEGDALPALCGTLGCVALGALGLRRAYRITVRFYYGDSGGKTASETKPDAAPAAAMPPSKVGSRFLELRLPAVPEQAAAVALATLRSMLRAPEVKMEWGSSFLVTLIIGSSLLFRGASKIPEAAKPFIATGAVVFSVFMLVRFFGNQFGFDRDGFRSLVLSPADRRLILLGKNLACLPAGVGFGLVLLAVVSVWLRLPALILLAALFQLAALLPLIGLVGNLLSILVPYRIQSGSLKPTKMPGLATLMMILCHLLFPLATAPVFVPPLAWYLMQRAGWPGAESLDLLLSITLAGLTGFVYWQTLGPMGRLLQRRETKILQVVKVEVE